MIALEINDSIGWVDRESFKILGKFNCAWWN